MAEAVSLRYMTAKDRIKLDSVYLLILMVKMAPGLVFSTILFPFSQWLSPVVTNNALMLPLVQTVVTVVYSTYYVSVRTHPLNFRPHITPQRQTVEIFYDCYLTVTMYRICVTDNAVVLLAEGQR
jgi:hypothetical protein